MDWETWIAVNKDNLKHIAGFEEQFVRSVLARIEAIEPQDVKTQYHFKDAHGGNRYIDFMVINESKGFLLPIELDGHWKALTYHEFDDMLSRQNALLREYGVLLRYTNKTMLNHPNQIINEIKYTLDLQSKNQLTKQIVDQQTAKRIEDYQKELELIKQQQANQANNSKHDNEETLTKEDLVALQAAITALQDKVDKVGQNQSTLDNNSSNSRYSLPVSEHSLPTNTKVKAGIQSINHEKATPTNKSGFKLQHMIAIGATSLILTAIGANAYFGQSQKDDYSFSEPMALSSESVDLDNEELIIPRDDHLNTTEEDVAESELLTLPVSSEESRASLQVEEEPIATAIDDPLPNNHPLDQTSYDTAISANIPASEAKNNIGSYSVVCGDIAQVKNFSKGTYLNFGDYYPKQEATIVVWNSDKDNFDDLYQYEGKSLCVEGTIDTYKGTPQIKLASVNNIK